MPKWRESRVEGDIRCNPIRIIFPQWLQRPSKDIISVKIVEPLEVLSSIGNLNGLHLMEARHKQGDVAPPGDHELELLQGFMWPNLRSFDMCMIKQVLAFCASQM